MKKFIALAVLASSTAFATESAIYDIQYLPTPGTTYGFTTYSHVASEVEMDSDTDEIGGYVVSQTIGHSFTDRWSLDASIDYTDLEYDPETGSKSDFAKGISDPTISTRFRTVDEKFRWDVIGGAILGLGDREIKSDGDTDNRQGGHSLFVGTQFGSKQELFQWAISGILLHDMEATTDDKESDVEYDAESHNSLIVRGDILNKLAEKSYLRSHLSVNFEEEYDLDFEGGGKTAFASQTTWEIGTEYQHLFSQDLLARVGVDYQMNNFRTGQIDDWNTWIISVGANYQF